MASPAASFFALQLLFALLLLLPSVSTPTGGATTRGIGGGDGAAALFIFGDSYFDPGNNNYIHTSTLDQANFWPYGESYFNFPTGRFSNGRLISDFIAEYGKLPLIPPYLQPGNQDYRRGANFASAGAGALVETFRGSVINLEQQLKYYTKVVTRLRLEFGDAESKFMLSNAVYLFSVGTNDYLTLLLSNSSMLQQQLHEDDDSSSSHSRSKYYVNMVIGNLTTVVKAIYEEGGRKFGFLNVGDLGCLPGVRILQSPPNAGCLAHASMLAKIHNHALHNYLSRMQDHLQGFKHSLFDFNTALAHRVNRPSQFGLKEGRAACCGSGLFKGIFSCGGKRPMVTEEFELCENPKEYVFWDSYHLTETVYEQMAAEMWNQSHSKRGHRDLKSLFRCTS